MQNLLVSVSSVVYGTFSSATYDCSYSDTQELCTGIDCAAQITHSLLPKVQSSSC